MAALWSMLLFVGATWAGSYPFHDRADGISCKRFDVALNVPWPGGQATGLDIDGRADGPRPYATLKMRAGDKSRVQRLDISALALAWWRRQVPNDGLLIKQSPGGPQRWHAREVEDMALRPQIELRFEGGQRRYVEPAADASLDCSTYKGLGPSSTLLLKSSAPLALRFELPATGDLGEPVSATLIMVREPGQSSGAVLSVYRLLSPVGTQDGQPQAGLAARYPQDANIRQHPQVVFADNFNSGDPDDAWAPGMRAPYDVVAEDAANGFEPLHGAALRVKIPAGGQVGLDIRYPFKKHLGHEPDEIYLRYYLRLAPDWLNAKQGGKLPGLSGTYGSVGWGGRAWDGQKGWSIRGAYDGITTQGHPAAGHIMLGSYAYHSGSSKYGEHLAWYGAGLAGLIRPNRWVCVEQHLRLNTPGRSDGVFKVWLDGRMAFERTDLRLRDLPDIHIQEAWMNVFHGGTAKAPTDLHAYIDNVVISREYIGPLSH